MLRITQLKLPIDHNEADLFEKVIKILKLPNKRFINQIKIVRQSLDARKRPELYYVYTVDVSVSDEKKVRRVINNKNIMLTKESSYSYPPKNQGAGERPVIVGSGPAGLFCAWMLAQQGYAPLILERGEMVEQRLQKVEAFWRGEVLDQQTNVQFGEGGAGTFSDGKLNTLVKDPHGRNFQVLKMFVDAGAPPEILYQQKPHLGTDLLMNIVKQIRREIEKLGGVFLFQAQMTDLLIRDGGLEALEINGKEWIDTSLVVCAVGHSARDTFSMLRRRGVIMEAKAFAAGVRIQHPQTMVNQAQYGCSEVPQLGPASYKLTYRARDGRGVYSFCMCPGGYVVNASSEAGLLAVNGMSYHDRNAPNANSALIVTVNPDDFLPYADPDTPPELAGLAFQRRLEKAAFAAADGAVPVQCYADFLENRPSKRFGEVAPCIKGHSRPANVREMLPEFMACDLAEAIAYFGQKINGFDRPDALLCGVESRTSSPVRIPRNEQMMSNVMGLIPCGEGAGYAGGITSAAMDGLRAAEAVCAWLNNSKDLKN